MKLSPGYLKLIAADVQSNQHTEARKMTALALMSLGGRNIGGNTFDALRELYDGYLRGKGDDEKLRAIARELLSDEGYGELMEIWNENNEFQESRLNHLGEWRS
jgi:hypothetical protein